MIYLFLEIVFSNVYHNMIKDDFDYIKGYNRYYEYILLYLSYTFITSIVKLKIFVRYHITVMLCFHFSYIVTSPLWFSKIDSELFWKKNINITYNQFHLVYYNL